MINKLLLTGLSAAALLTAADHAGFKIYTPGELANDSKTAAATLNAQKFAGKTLDQFDKHYTMIAHREATGDAEMHETETDLFVIQGGTATLLVGGTLESPRTVKEGEVRGTSLKGADKYELKPGDVVNIPSKIPHQILIKPGIKFDYFVVKLQ